MIKEKWGQPQTPRCAVLPSCGPSHTLRKLPFVYIYRLIHTEAYAKKKTCLNMDRYWLLEWKLSRSSLKHSYTVHPPAAVISIEYSHGSDGSARVLHIPFLTPHDHIRCIIMVQCVNEAADNIRYVSFWTTGRHAHAHAYTSWNQCQMYMWLTKFPAGKQSSNKAVRWHMPEMWQTLPTVPKHVLHCRCRISNVPQRC